MWENILELSKEHHKDSSRTRIFSIGNTVLTGPNVFISDHNHAYEDVEKPISAQGNIENNNKVIIDDDCWIGTNVVICGNVHIGKHIVIGAGTFVNKDIPSYCVAVGNPARVVKKYNFERGEWEKV
ncbi:acyltransferase [uncultured Holdemanella sp.]|uniref:acyltransferase n=1 Tax=uncultured Holdemanella sp. TaxID=1763549 RepID=UPI0025F8657C|nr:acyltransferase [uncultured Holdemanella sp.]